MPAETKAFALEELTLGDGADAAGPGSFGGYVAVYGNVDHGRDRIARGACADTTALLASAYLFYGHDYRQPPIGIIREARDESKGLYIAGTFHSTPDAQAARTVARERADAGLQMGLSIGYDPEEWSFDQDVAGAPVRVLEKITVREGSLVPFPMNERAQLEDVKATWSASFVNDLPDSAFAYVEPGGEKDADGKTVPRSLRHFPHHGPGGAVDLPHLRNALSRAPQSPFGERALPHLERHAAAEGVGEAGKALHALEHALDDLVGTESGQERSVRSAAHEAEVKEGRAISGARRDRIAARLARIKEDVADLEALLRETEPPPKGLDRARFEFERIAARLRAEGVKV